MNNFVHIIVMLSNNILYSFRRCPYAMRGRMGLSYAAINYQHREIVLRDKPTSMLSYSPKGTVPVLILKDGTVIDESLDIMRWALSKNDPDDWLGHKHDTQTIDTLIEENDLHFKKHLDRYKYPHKFDLKDGIQNRNAGLVFIEQLECLLTNTDYLCGDKITLADIAIFPFIRQFAHVDRNWFYAQPYPHIQKWLLTHLDSDLFKTIMRKHNLWHDNLLNDNLQKADKNHG